MKKYNVTVDDNGLTNWYTEEGQLIKTEGNVVEDTKVTKKYEKVDFSELKGQTLVSITMDPDKTELDFTTDKGVVYSMYHEQDCCEQVFIEDICGDLDDLIGVPLVEVEETSNSEDESIPGYDDYYVWTFYRLAGKGTVTIRWYGASNGYYSVGVNFVKES